jgi:hypothetical protein
LSLDSNFIRRDWLIAAVYQSLTVCMDVCQSDYPNDGRLWRRPAPKSAAILYWAGDAVMVLLSTSER